MDSCDQDSFWEEEGELNWLADSHDMIADINFDEDGNTPAFAMEYGEGELASSYDFLPATSATATIPKTKTVKQERIAKATPVIDASIAHSKAIENQATSTVSNQLSISNQFSIVRAELIRKQCLDSTYFDEVTPVSSSNQIAPVSSNAVEQQNLHSGFPITNAQAIQTQVASTSFNQTQYAPATTDTFNYQQPVKHSADNGLWEQQSFDFQSQLTPSAAQNARVNATSSTPQPIGQPRSTPANGHGNLASYKKPVPAWMEKGGHAGASQHYTPLQRPEVVRATTQPQSTDTPSAPPNASSAGTMNGDQLKEALAKVGASFPMSLLRATLDAPTRTTSQRQLLRVVNLFGVDGKTDANISPNFRSSLDGIWKMFNTNVGYQKMLLIYVVEKILQQNPELGNDVDQIQSANGDLIAKIGSLEASDPELLTKARDLLFSEFIHHGHLLEISKAISQNTIKQIETEHEVALKAKQAELDQTLKRMQEMQAETKKMEASMKGMQFKMKQLMTQMSGMQASLTESNQRCQVAHEMNSHLMNSATPEQIAAATAASRASSPSKATSNYQPESSNQKKTITAPFDPKPAVTYYFPDEPLTPPPSKKRKAGPVYTGQFYQCRAVAKLTNEICGVINNQFMVGGKKDGDERQRCVSSTCKKYTDVKDKHWVPDRIAAQYRVGQKAPLDCVLGGDRMEDVQMTPTPTPAPTRAKAPAPVPAPKNVQQPAMYNHNQQQGSMYNQQSTMIYNPEPTPAPTPAAAAETYTSPYPTYPASTSAASYTAPTPAPAIERDKFEGLGAVQAFLSSSPSPAPVEQPEKYFKNHMIRTANADSLTMPAPPPQFSS
ncbi:hypothetical protein IFR05_013720 [Cadophora sp. M221]|nr:hypothetical protein IFR05_013720 [Cadophora sp. M221]